MNGEMTFESWKAQQTPELQEAMRLDYLETLQSEKDLEAIGLIVGQSQGKLAVNGEPTREARAKLKRSAGIALRKFRACVNHMGGQVDIVVRMPNHPPIQFDKISDAEVRTEQHNLSDLTS